MAAAGGGDGGDDAAYFESFGLSAQVSRDQAGSKQNAPALRAVFEAAAASEGGMDAAKEHVQLLFQLATGLKGASEVVSSQRLYVVPLILSGKVTRANLNAVVAYLKKRSDVVAADLDDAALAEECGVGVVVSDDEVKTFVETWFAENGKAEVEAKGGWSQLGKVMGVVRQDSRMKWGDAKVAKDTIDAEMIKLLGERKVVSKADRAAQKADARRAARAKASAVKSAAAAAADAATDADPAAAAAAAAASAGAAPELIRFPPPEENTQNKPDILQAHLKATGGVVVCRFPPEPNGFLHIGHAKSMNLNFTYPVESGGYTNMRFDDTNPEAEKQEYVDAILEDVAWLGHKPKQVRFASDDFDQLHAWAVQLIKAGKAYVCHQTGEEIKRDRITHTNSPWRDTPVEENLRKFEDMRRGRYEEGAATLRLKMDMQSTTATMWDLIAYRIKYTPHPHAGDKWCIYPSYDFTHCLSDSIENITHSLCTVEFIARRESYFWLLDALNLYKPVVFEYSRLNITNTVLSKRRLIKLVTSGTVKGWDDPRMPTISGFRRRGFTPSAINNFCQRIGITRSQQEIAYAFLEECLREDLDSLAKRGMCVLRPVRVVVRNWDDAVSSAGGDVAPAVAARNGKVEAPHFPRERERGMHSVDVSQRVWIDSDDFCEVPPKGYKRLSIGATVGLSHWGAALTAVSCTKGDDGAVTEVVCDIDFAPKKKPGAFIHWVAAPAEGGDDATPATAEVRLYDVLFNSKTPAALDDYLADINPNSLTVVQGAYIDAFLATSAHEAATAGRPGHVQFERQGYFVVDKDSRPHDGHIVFNRAVALKSGWKPTPAAGAAAAGAGAGKK